MRRKGEAWETDHADHFTSRALRRSSRELLSFVFSCDPPPASGEAVVSASVPAGASRLSCCFHISSRSLSWNTAIGSKMPINNAFCLSQRAGSEGSYRIFPASPSGICNTKIQTLLCVHSRWPCVTECSLLFPV